MPQNYLENNNNNQPPEIFYDMYYYNLFPMTNDIYNIINSLIKNFRNSNFKIIDTNNISHYETAQDILQETFNDITDPKIFEKLNNNELVYIDLKIIMDEFDKNIDYYNFKINEVVNVIHKIRSENNIYDINETNQFTSVIEFYTVILNYYELFPILITFLKEKIEKQFQIHSSSDTLINKLTNSKTIDVIDNSYINSNIQEMYNENNKLRQESKLEYLNITISDDIQKEKTEIENIFEKIKNKELINTDFNSIMIKIKKLAWIYEEYSNFEDIVSRLNRFKTNLDSILFDYTVNGDLLDLNINKTNLYMILSRYYTLLFQIFNEKKLQQYTLKKLKDFILLITEDLPTSIITNLKI